MSGDPRYLRPIPDPLSPREGFTAAMVFTPILNVCDSPALTGGGKAAAPGGGGQLDWSLAQGTNTGWIPVVL